jgi:hypothetical protein
MARTFTLVWIGLLGITTLAGCASNSGVVDVLPAPSFAGPVIVPQRGPAPLLAQAAPPRLLAPTMAGIDRAWIPNAAPRPWKWIVIHHSASPSGNAAKFDKEHRAKGWDELGYHFVIGNGTDSGNGQVEVGPRWPKQKWGAHAKTADNRYNDFGIGICLVGNFDIERPTPQQLQSLAKLTAYLMKTYHIPASNVIGHRDTKPTDCPGRNLNIAVVRRMATQMLAEAAPLDEETPQLAGVHELLFDDPALASQD